MRVVAATPFYPPHSLVGAWLATHGCLKYLAGRGHDVTVVTNTASSYTLDGVNVTNGKLPSGDIAITHCGDRSRLGEIAAQGIPHVRMAHGVNPDTLGADLVVFNSRSLEDATDFDGASMVVHPPIEPKRVKATPGHKVTLINCSADKGIKQVWRIADNLPDVPFLGVRGGHGHQITPRARNFETIPATTDMKSVYGQTGILLMPSLYETWGMVGVEAMISGIPVVAHPTPGLKESLGSAGIFVERNDTAAWCQAIRALSEPDAYKAASKRALARAAELTGTSQLDDFSETVEALV